MSQDYKLLKPGDKIRLLRVPACDILQRKREIRDGLEDAGWTADTIERIISQCPVVTIDRIDEYKHPWFECELKRDDGSVEFHSLAIYESESWERFR